MNVRPEKTHLAPSHFVHAVRVSRFAFCIIAILGMYPAIAGASALADGHRVTRDPGPISATIERGTQRDQAHSIVMPLPSTFFVRSYGGKCLDFGASPQVGGAPVFIYDCNRTIAQQIRIEEINDRHEVILHAGTMVLGITK